MTTIRALIAAKNRPETPTEIAERQRNKTACERARAETAERFPTITPENFAEANAFQERRIRELQI